MNVFYTLVRAAAVLWIAAAAAPVPAVAQKMLSGELHDTIRLSHSPYLVTGTVIIPPGETVVIEAGVALMFKSFTGLQIQGQLIASGTESLPVVFTSENDRRFAPRSSIEAAAYDWDGITIDESGAGTRLSNAEIRYSLFGINSLTASIKLESCTFAENGKANLTINGKKETTGTRPFSYGLHSNIEYSDTVQERSTATAPILEPPPASPDKAAMPPPQKHALAGSPEPSPKWSSQTGRLLVRTGGITLAVAGGAFGAFEYLNYTKSLAAFDAINDTTNPANAGNLRESAARWEEARRNKNIDMIGTIAGCGVALLGALGFSLTFFF
jgi:hypothetical protein